MSAPSRDEVKRILISLLPPGSEQLYALENSDVIGGTLYGLAGALKDSITDRIEVLRSNCNPATLTLEGLPEWEAACGLTNTPITLYGTVAQRVNAVIATLRISGSFSLDDIRAIVQPYFLYADPSQIQILENDRAALRTLHTYVDPGTYTVPAGTTIRPTINIADNPRVSQAGAIALVLLTTARPDLMNLVLVGPDGTRALAGQGYLTQVAAAVTNKVYQICAPGLAGKRISGRWTLEANNPSVGFTLRWSLYVEGQGVIYDTATPPNRIGEGLGAPVFTFAVAADPGLLGAGYDLVGAQRAITRWKPAHTFGFVVTGSPISGSLCAVPDTDNAIPDYAIAC